MNEYRKEGKKEERDGWMGGGGEGGRDHPWKLINDRGFFDG